MDYTKKIYFYIEVFNGSKNAIISRLIGNGSSKRYFEEYKEINECFSYLVESGYIEQIKLDEMESNQKKAVINDGDIIYRKTNKRFE